jgi:hypothetical protein
MSPQGRMAYLDAPNQLSCRTIEGIFLFFLLTSKEILITKIVEASGYLYA